MKFSIVIPAYNAAGHIRKALDSIRSQTFTDYELIVVCDSCTDDTEQIAKEYGAVTKAVQYGATGRTRNDGLAMATGEWVLFLDDDDWWLHEFVLEMLDQRLKDEDVLCFGFIWRGVGYCNQLFGHRYIAVWNKCWRRSAIGNTKFGEWKGGSDDVQFHGDMMNKPLRITEWDMPFYYYNYMRPGSQTADKVEHGEVQDLRKKTGGGGHE